jgi:hypothetical protein
MKNTTNSGGIAQLSVIAQDNTSGLTALDAFRAKQPEANYGYAYEELAMSDDPTPTWETIANESNAGRIIEFKATFRHAGFSAEKTETLNNLMAKPLYVAYLTHNAQLMIAENIFLSYSPVTGSTPGVTSGYDIELSGKMVHDPYFIV